MQNYFIYKNKMAPSDSHTHAQLSLTACSADKPYSSLRMLKKHFTRQRKYFEISQNKWRSEYNNTNCYQCQEMMPVDLFSLDSLFKRRAQKNKDWWSLLKGIMLSSDLFQIFHWRHLKTVTFGLRRETLGSSETVA